MSLSPYFQPSAGGDTVFSVESAKIKFGFGALEEIGADARALKMTRVAVYADANVARLEPVSIVVAALKKTGNGCGCICGSENQADRSRGAKSAIQKER